MLEDSVRGVAFRLEGRVQRVSFRWYGREVAIEVGVKGWIRNRIDGGVEGEAFGGPSMLQLFLNRLGQGPPAARVDNLEWEVIPEEDVPLSFEIRS